MFGRCSKLGEFFLIVCSALGLIILPGSSVNAGGGADIIFHNGIVITMNDGQPTAEALAVQDKLILAVGSDEEILLWQGQETIVVDLEGRTLRMRVRYCIWGFEGLEG